MKSLTIALTVFFVIVASVVVFDIYIERVCGSLSDMACAFPDSIGEDGVFEKFSEKWEKNRAVFDLTIGRDEAERIDDSYNEAAERYSSGDTAGYIAARRKLINSIRDVLEAESFTVQGLF